jgi:hypothetical protein
VAGNTIYVRMRNTNGSNQHNPHLKANAINNNKAPRAKEEEEDDDEKALLSDAAGKSNLKGPVAKSLFRTGTFLHLVNHGRIKTTARFWRQTPRYF